jgi:acetyltransferase-like isoleucine patch superfamily enzyme
MQSLINLLRSCYWRLRLRIGGASVGTGFRVQGPVKILLRDGATLRSVSIGHRVTFDGTTYIRIRKQGRLTIGNDVRTGTEVWLVCANDTELAVGDRTVLGHYTILNGGHGLRIGRDCVFAAFIYINSSEHRIARGQLIREQGFDGRPVSIGDDVWIGGHVTVLKGVNIGTGAVIGANAVVNKDVPEYCIAAGVPARVLRERT